ncbi:MAG TPA: acyl-CoA thioesterase [Pseudolysinimonas sp.]|nr:acyl-CoA thioesterase [Pseudolysinimonas sp.]
MTARTTSGVEQEFRMDIGVRLLDLDPNGHVNHASYLSYAETARVRHLSAAGRSPARLAASGLAVVVLRLEIDYRRELVWDDPVSATSRFRFEGARSAFRNTGRVLAGDQVAAELEVVLGVLDLASRRLTKDSRAILAKEGGISDDR